MLLLAGRLSRAEPINQRTTAQLSCQIGNNNAGKRKKGEDPQDSIFKAALGADNKIIIPSFNSDSTR